MSVLSEFFHGSETQLGIFAPRDYLVALFPNYPAARKAQQTLLDAGFFENEVIAVPGEDVVDLLHELGRRGGLGTFVMQQLSRMFETEEVYADHDFKLASRGASFFAAYTPNRLRKEEAWKLIEAMGPIVARHYSLGGVEHLAGET